MTTYVGFRVDKPTLRKLREICKLEEIPLSQLIRRILRKYEHKN